jgi:hypothetical protein
MKKRRLTKVKLPQSEKKIRGSLPPEEKNGFYLKKVSLLKK